MKWGLLFAGVVFLALAGATAWIVKDLGSGFMWIAPGGFGLVGIGLLIWFLFFDSGSNRSD